MNRGDEKNLKENEPKSRKAVSVKTQPANTEVANTEAANTEAARTETGRTKSEDGKTGKSDFGELEFVNSELETEKPGKLDHEEIDLEEIDLEEMDLDKPEPQTAEGLEIEDLEDWGEDDDWEEAQAVKPWMVAAILAGLMVLAAVICAILWNVTHSDRGNVDNPSGVEEDTETEDQDSQDGEQSDQPGGAGQGGEQSDQPGGAGQEGEQSDQPGGAGQEGEQSDQPGGAGQEGEQSDQPGGADQDGNQSQPGDQQSPDNQPQSDSLGQASGDQGQEITMSFTPVQESVTAKDVTNLRSKPSTLDNETITAQISNGEVITRTGVNSDTGWARVEYNGQTLYAVSQLLTTDLNYKTPVQPADPNRVVTAEGRVVIFTDCDDNVSPKMYVNLRLEPSTAQGNDTIHCQISNGQTVHRTGWSEDAGWSRVEYDGNVLYVVTSFLSVVEAQ